MLTPLRRTCSRPLRWALVVPLALGVACGDSPENPVARPEAPETTSAPAGFDELPRPVPSDPVGPAAEAGGGVARSFEAPGTTPREVMAFYTEELKADGWVPVGSVEEQGLDDFSGQWTNPQGGQRLRVTARETPGLGGEEDRAAPGLTAFTVSLGPA